MINYTSPAIGRRANRRLTISTPQPETTADSLKIKLEKNLTTSQKRNLFLRLVEIIHCNADIFANPEYYYKQFSPEIIVDVQKFFKNIFAKLDLTENDLKYIIKNSQPPFFSMFYLSYKTPMHHLLAELEYDVSKLSEPGLTKRNALVISFDGLDLSQLDFSKIDFHFPNIPTHTRSYYVEIAEKQLKVSFANTCLDGTNFEYANLSGIVFNDISCVRTKFDHAELIDCKFERCIFENTSFLNTILFHASFVDLDFRNVNFNSLEKSRTHKECMVNYSSFINCRFFNSTIDVTSGTMVGVDFRNSNLTNLTFLFPKKNIEFNYIQFENADLSLQSLANVHFSNVNFDYATIIFSDFSNCKFTNTTFYKSNLTDSIFNNVTIYQLNFKQADLTNVINNFSLSLADLEDRFIPERLFIPRDGHGYLIDAIDSIQDTFIDLKLKLFHFIINKIQAATPEAYRRRVSQLLHSFVRVFRRNPHYFTDPILLNFIKHFNNREIFNANTDRFFLRKEEADFWIYYAKTKYLDRDFYENNAGFICRLIYCLKQEIQTRVAAFEIEKRYLQYAIPTDAVQHTYELISMTYGYEEGESPNSIKSNMLLSSADKIHFILISYDYYERFMLEKSYSLSEIKNWNQFFYFYFNRITEKYENFLGELEVNHLFKKIPLFDRKYSLEIMSKVNKNFLELFDMPHEDKDRFFVALQQGFSCYKDYIREEGLQRLTSIFKNCVQNDEFHSIESIGSYAIELQLDEKFAEKLLQNYDLTNASNKEKSIAFATFCALFTKLSSSRIFGKEGHEPDEELSLSAQELYTSWSPIILRNMALASINKAMEYDSNLFSELSLRDIQYRLAGLDDHFTCASAIYSTLFEKLNSEYTFSMIFPPALK